MSHLPTNILASQALQLSANVLTGTSAADWKCLADSP